MSLMTPQMEKVFFNYILHNKKFFDVVKPFFFRNSEIQFVYNIVRTYMITATDPIMPSNRQILDMITIEDKEGMITKEILRSILQVDLKEYDEKNFIEPMFNAWILSNRLKTGTVDIIEETRGLDSISDFEKAVEAADRIKAIVNEMASTNFVDDDDMGTDFDDAESHIQDSARFKVKCGFESIDHMLGGGWDIGTLNVIMAETNNGKCFFENTHLTIRESDSKKITIDRVDKIFTIISKCHNNI